MAIDSSGSQRLYFGKLKSVNKKVLMKKFQILLAAAFCGVIFSVATSASAQNGSATVMRVEGMVSYSLGNDQWVPLVAGKILPVGAVIRTDHNGVADIVLGKDIDLPQNASQSRWEPSYVAQAPDANVRGMASYRPAAEQNVVRITPNSTLGIDKLTVIDTGADTVSDTELDLKKGQIFASVKKLTGASQYLIKLPNGIAGVRGTQFSISAGGATTVYHSTGGGVVLSLVSPSGIPQTTIVGAGFSFNPTTGQLVILPGDELTFLERLFTALQTIYSPVSYVSVDSTCIYISPTHGNGHHDGGKK
jgi:hypothetical protein